jgi:hypothetical protein
MRYYFEDHGCLRCDKTSVIYGGNRFCETCRQMLQYHIQASLKRAAFEKLARVGASYPAAILTVQRKPHSVSSGASIADNLRSLTRDGYFCKVSRASDALHQTNRRLRD